MLCFKVTATVQTSQSKRAAGGTAGRLNERLLPCAANPDGPGGRTKIQTGCRGRKTDPPTPRSAIELLARTAQETSGQEIYERNNIQHGSVRLHDEMR